MAVDDRVTHHGEGAAFAAQAAETQVFVVEAFPQQLHQAGELFRGDPRAGSSSNAGWMHNWRSSCVQSWPWRSAPRKAAQTKWLAMVRSRMTAP